MISCDQLGLLTDFFQSPANLSSEHCDTGQRHCWLQQLQLDRLPLHLAGKAARQEAHRADGFGAESQVDQVHQGVVG